MTKKEKKTEEREKKKSIQTWNREIWNAVGVLYTTTFRMFSLFMLSCRGTAKELVVVVRADDEAV